MEEGMESSEKKAFENFELQLNESAKGFLKEAAKWAYFLSILGYIGIGILVLIAVFAGSIFAKMGSMTPGMSGFGGMGFVFSFIYIIMAAVYFFPIYYINQFASKAKLALQTNDSETLATSFGYLKSHYKFFGIISLIMVCLYALVILFAGITFLATSIR
jgi:hypothetical protein